MYRCGTAVGTRLCRHLGLYILNLLNTSETFSSLLGRVGKAGMPEWGGGGWAGFVARILLKRARG